MVSTQTQTYTCMRVPLSLYIQRFRDLFMMKYLVLGYWLQKYLFHCTFPKHFDTHRQSCFAKAS